MCRGIETMTNRLPRMAVLESRPTLEPLLKASTKH